MRTFDIVVLLIAAAALVLAGINPKPLKEYQLNLVAFGVLGLVLIPLVTLLRAT